MKYVAGKSAKPRPAMPASRISETDDIYSTFKHDVNMTAGELSTWLKTDESKSVG